MLYQTYQLRRKLMLSLLIGQETDTTVTAHREIRTPKPRVGAKNAAMGARL
jgi:hypothetical protein